MSPILRLAGPHDIGACSRFEWTRDEDDLRQHVDAGLLYLAVEEGVAVGYLRLESFWKSMPYLALIVVEEARRGHGIGSRLLSFACDDQRSRGASWLLSSSTRGEEGPRRWHLRNGFEEIGSLRGLNAGGADETFYRLRL